MGRLRRACASSATALTLALVGCWETPPTLGGTTDASATDGDQGGGSSTGGQAGVDETGAVGEALPFDHRTYFIAESVKFDGGGSCDNDDLNTVTKRLRNRLDDAGWTGLRFVDDDAWPEDFREATLIVNGADDSFGDAHRLAVFAGHGAPGLLQWGRPSDHGECRLRIQSQARLGRLAGDTAAAVMLMTSCTLRTDVLWPNFEHNAARQFFGYHNSPYIGGGEPRRVFKRTQDGQSTKDAWLDEMEQNAALGKNSPVVLTAGVSGMEAIQAHGATNLASGVGFIDSVGEPADAFFFEWLDNGCTPSCGECQGITSVEVPSMLVGATVPIVQMERPRRSGEALVDRASTLVAVLQGESVSSAQRTRLAEWAQAILACQDVAVTMLPGEPAIRVVYEPVIDRLVVDDLDAREAARPGASETVDDGRRRTELEKAGKVRDEVIGRLSAAVASTLVGLPTAPTFSLTTREAGLIERRGTSTTGSIPFEYVFSSFGVFDGHPVFDARLEIGVTRYGRLSRIAVSGLDVRRVASAAIVRSPEEAWRVLERDIEARNPKMLRYDITAARVGLALPPGTSSAALASPELFADYVVTYPGYGTPPAVSRRQPTSISLIAPSAPMPREDPDGTTDDLGDSRHEAPARPVRR